MIIKGLFKRYERWNPVHPTAGAFWGMGLGIGCGVGWGPGFGPEVIGYVGAGCGLGFCVGFTLAGVGVGLPQNSLLSTSFAAATRSYENLESLGVRMLAAGRRVALGTSNMRKQSCGKLLEGLTPHRHHHQHPRGKRHFCIFH